MAASVVAPVFKASVSSLAATVADGVVYQALLFVCVGHYGVAAAAGAVAGAVTNFSINRQWTFAATEQNALVQAFRYAIVSLLTFLCLRSLLWLLIEVLGVGMRIAWLPAKLLAFLMISYPLQKCWVFKVRTA